MPVSASATDGEIRDNEIRDREFRDEVRTWLAEHMVGEYAELHGAGGPGLEH